MRFEYKLPHRVQVVTNGRRFSCLFNEGFDGQIKMRPASLLVIAQQMDLDGVFIEIAELI